MKSIPYTETKYMLTVRKKMSVRKTMITAEEIERYISEH